ncbi:hypothetical protein D3C81_1941080 [compost metagenome]
MLAAMDKPGAWAPSICCTASLMHCRLCVTARYKTEPLTVRLISLPLRSNSGVPRLDSRRLICLLTALCVRCSSVAARVKVPRRTTASKATMALSGGSFFDVMDKYRSDAGVGASEGSGKR